MWWTSTIVVLVISLIPLTSSNPMNTPLTKHNFFGPQDYYDEGYELPELYDISSNNEQAFPKASTHCQVEKYCSSSNSNSQTSQVVVKGCQTHVDCYDVAEFPYNIPAEASIITFEACKFANLSYENMKNFTNLLDMFLGFNDLFHIAPRTFLAQADMKILRIQGNNLSDILPYTFFGLNSVITVVLSNNEIQRIYPESFNGLSAVTELNMNLNKIQVIEDYSFTGMTLLESLILQDNRITSISANAFRSLVNLKTLNLKHNQLQTIPTRSLKSLSKLTTLFLGENPINAIVRNDMKGMKSLRHLSMEACSIRRIGKKAFQDKNLNTLVLENNQLTTLPNMGRMSQLTLLNLDNNPWSCSKESIPMLNWLHRHEFAEMLVLCSSPEFRRGQNLLQFSQIELLNNVGAPGPSPAPEPPLQGKLTSVSPDAFVSSLKTTSGTPDDVIALSTISYNHLPTIKLTNATEPPIFQRTVQAGFNHTLFFKMQSVNFTDSDISSGDDERHSTESSAFFTKIDKYVATISYRSNEDLQSHSPVSTTEIKSNRTLSKPRPTLKRKEGAEVLDSSFVIAVIAAMSIALIAMVAFIAWRMRARHLRQRHRSLHRGVEMVASSEGGSRSSTSDDSTNHQSRLQRQKNGKRRRPKFYKNRHNGIKSLEGDINNSKNGEKFMAGCTETDGATKEFGHSNGNVPIV